MTTIVQEPVTEEPRRGKRRKVRIAIAIVLALVVGALGFRVYGALSLLASGERVDIGGRHIFIRCSGSGSPTVILEHGLGESGFDWTTVQDTVDETTRVCYTSRAGMGFSDPVPGDGVRTSQDAVDDLSAVLTAADVPGPYVLVGHSFGGPIVRLFADQHRSDVAGMVLVDTTHEDQITRMREEMSPEVWSEMSVFLEDNAERMDLEASGAEVAVIDDLGDLPLVVLQATEYPDDEAPRGISKATIDEVNALSRSLDSELQLDLANLSTNSTHVLVEGSGHFVQIDRPDAVIDAINSVLGE